MLYWDTQHCPTIYSGAFHAVCMTARVESHGSRYMAGQTLTRSSLRHTHTHTEGEGVEVVKECEKVY